jgi:hypothetical protein
MFGRLLHRHVSAIDVGAVEAPTTPGGSLIVTPDPFNAVNRDLIIDQASRHAVPAIFYNRFYPNQAA